MSSSGDDNMLLHTGRYGSHVHTKYVGASTISEHLLAAIKQARECGVLMRTCQVFISSPKARKLLAPDLKLAETLLKHDVVGFAHGSYCDVPWSDTVAKYSASFIRKELVAAGEHGLVGLIIHLPAATGAEITAKGIEEVFSKKVKSKVILYLEIPVIKPEKSIWHSPAALANLLSILSPKTRAHVGICVDTAHLHACGVKIREYDEAKTWFDELALAVAPLIGNRIFIHFNDSKSAFGSGIDIHDSIGSGTIWSGIDIHASGAKAVIDFVNKNKLSAVFERNNIEPYPIDYMALQSAQVISG